MPKWKIEYTDTSYSCDHQTPTSHTIFVHADNKVNAYLAAMSKLGPECGPDRGSLAIVGVILVED